MCQNITSTQKVHCQLVHEIDKDHPARWALEVHLGTCCIHLSTWQPLVQIRRNSILRMPETVVGMALGQVHSAKLAIAGVVTGGRTDVGMPVVRVLAATEQEAATETNIIASGKKDAASRKKLPASH